MRIAAAAAADMDLPTPGLDLALALYEELARRGDADRGTQALYRLFEAASRQAAVAIP